MQRSLKEYGQVANNIMRLLFFILLFASIAGCRKNDGRLDLPKSIRFPSTNCTRKTNHLDTVKQMIVGTYDWAYTFYRQWRQPAEIWTPQNKGLTYRYVFRPNSQVDYYENNKLVWTNDYVVDYEFKVSTYPLDSLTMVIINDRVSGHRKEYFRAYLCNDSAIFYNPYSSVDVVRHFGRQ
jgi:hypothetical protein